MNEYIAGTPRTANPALCSSLKPGPGGAQVSLAALGARKLRLSRAELPWFSQGNRLEHYFLFLSLGVAVIFTVSEQLGILHVCEAAAHQSNAH